MAIWTNPGLGAPVWIEKKTYEMKCDEISKNSTFCLNFPFCTMVLGIDYECLHIV